MKLTVRALVFCACLTALVTVGVTAYPALAEDLAVDLWDGPDWRSRLTDSERRARELAKVEEPILRRTSLRAETVEDLIAGRIGADEAVRRFDELNRTSPSTRRWVCERYAGDTDEERAARQLIGHLRSRHVPRGLKIADEVEGGLKYPATR